MGDVDGMVQIFTQTPLRKRLHCMKYSSTKERFASLDCFQNLFLHWMKILREVKDVSLKIAWAWVFLRVKRSIVVLYY